MKYLVHGSRPRIYSRRVTAVALLVGAALFAKAGKAGVPAERDPHIFSSRAIAIERTPLDHKWLGANRALLKYRDGAKEVIRLAAKAEGLQRLGIVNDWVNRKVRYSAEPAGVDFWQSPDETLRRGRGDCEDIAMLKLALLQAASKGREGFLVIARDLVLRADHAVAVAFVGDEPYLLDNRTDRLVPATARDLLPVFTYNGSKKWTHGFRRSA